MSSAVPEPHRPVDDPDRARSPSAELDAPPGSDGSAPVPAVPLGTPGGTSADEFLVPARRALAHAVGAALALAASGIVLGLLWVALAPRTPVFKTAEGLRYARSQPEQPIAADGWFSLLGIGFGVLAAVAFWLLLRRHRGPLGLVALLLGCLGAAVVAWRLGRQIGRSTYQRLVETGPYEQPFDRPVDLNAGGVDYLVGLVPVPYGNLLLPAFAAAVTYTLLAGWSRWPSLRPEPDLTEVSWAPEGSSAPAAAPEPPAPGAAEPPRG